ncbi:DUF1836 domain-containing protein [Fusibacter paucivorans]|uniref:DUF1836 domain-containing protein n=1 Tax=Fusibacter paucivorans TaxID=76009 RepID=A0ABS5PS69_9FIRM|nr:DUF1836 domain-containing protein [Fusibacter paucivorans]MBS7527211.1 DUF1836 domain-containing protein [Fusibacter paucivorans]
MTPYTVHQLPEITDMPTIGLYMDQLLELLDHYLGSLKRSSQDVIFTKTMVNNYVKAGVITPPVKKKYARESMIELMMVYYFKQIFSINDTAALVTLIMNAHQDNRIAAYETFKNRVTALTTKPPSTSDDKSSKSRINGSESHTANVDTVLHYALSAVIEKQRAEYYMDTLNTVEI